MLNQHEGVSPSRADFLSDLAVRLDEARRAVAASSAALERLEQALAAAERRVALISAAPSDPSPGRVALVPAGAPPPQTAALAVRPCAGETADADREALLDAVVDRVDQLREACEGLLKRPLRGYERPIVLEWAQLERDGRLVPVQDILAVASRVLARPTRDGTLPSNLRWCDETVQTLRRQPVGAARWSAATERSVEYAALYERLADELDRVPRAPGGVGR